MALAGPGGNAAQPRSYRSIGRTSKPVAVLYPGRLPSGCGYPLVRGVAGRPTTLISRETSPRLPSLAPAPSEGSMTGHPAVGPACILDAERLLQPEW